MNIVLNISCSKVWNNNKFSLQKKSFIATFLKRSYRLEKRGYICEKIKMIAIMDLCENVVTIITHQLQFVTTNRCEKYENMYIYRLIH